MKNKFIISAFAASQILLITAQAEANLFMGASSEFVRSENINIFGSQPLNEIVGSNGQTNQLKIGLDMQDLRIFGYLWQNSTKNDEIGCGIGADFVFGELLIPDLKYRVGGQAGYGWQSVAGNQASTSTNMTKVGYIIGNTATQPTTITYTDDTTVIQIKLNLGLTYQISRNWSIDGGYTFTTNEYGVSYRNNDNPSVLNSINESQHDHSLSVGINYIFQ
jgi:opacity protein-like surface antigen